MHHVCVCVRVCYLHRTSDKPTPQALARLSHLAHTCLAATSLLIEQGLPHTQSTDPHTDPHTDSTTQAFERAVVGALFSPQAQQFDVLLTLREEALPLAADAAPAWLTAGVGKRCRQPDALSRALDEMEAQAPPKRARAFLNAFPEKVRVCVCARDVFVSPCMLAWNL